MNDLIGQEVAGFRILREIARGGMGVVFEAEQVSLGRPVAFKMLHPALTVDRDFLRRFEREAKTLARLNHESIVNVIDFVEHNDCYFLALEFVEGETLTRRLRRCARQRRFFSTAGAATIVWQVAQALAFAHERHIIHRDLKPDNVMLTSRGRAKVMDFGIARTLGASTDTEAGVRVGTPDYMAPEQLRGQAADERSDLFSLGLIFYEMLAGCRPFSQADLLRSDPDVPAALPWDEGRMSPGSDRVQPILERLLAFDPVCRYASANELIEDMRERLGAEFLGDEAWTTPPKPMASEIVEEAPPQAEPAARRVWSRRLVLVGGTLLLLALLLFAGVIVYHMQQQGKLDATMANFQGFIADSQGRTTEAETLFLRAIDVDPGVAHYWRDLGDFYVKYGQSEKAIHYYRKTLELDASDDETSRRLKALEVGTTATTQTAERAP